MIKKLEIQIRDLQKELIGIRKEQAILRLQPCLGDSEMRRKEEKFDDLELKAKALNRYPSRYDKKTPVPALPTRYKGYQPIRSKD